MDSDWSTEVEMTALHNTVWDNKLRTILCQSRNANTVTLKNKEEDYRSKNVTNGLLSNAFRQAPVFSLVRKPKPSMTSALGENPVSSPNAKHIHNTGKINNNKIVYFLYLCYSLIDAILSSPPAHIQNTRSNLVQFFNSSKTEIQFLIKFPK